MTVVLETMHMHARNLQLRLLQPTLPKSQAELLLSLVSSVQMIRRMSLL